MPNGWVPLYNSVSFTHMPYKKCIENRAWQDKILSKTMKYGGIFIACAFAAGSFHFARSSNFASSFDELFTKLKF